MPKNKGLELYGYVIMPSHIHLLCRVNHNFHFSDFIIDFKRYTSKVLISNIENEVESRREWLFEKFSAAAGNAKKEQKYKIWQDGYYAIDTWSLSQIKLYPQKFNK